MNKKILTAVSALALVACVGIDTADARDGFYVSVKGGRTNPNMNSTLEGIALGN